MCVPRRWRRNSDGDSSRPSSDANRRSRRFCSRRWIRSDAVGAGRAAARTGGDGKACTAAARSAAEAACGAALPWPLDTASGATAAAAPPPETLPAAAEHSAPWTATATRNRNRSIVAS